jgi:TubC N-terminal docking domain
VSTSAIALVDRLDALGVSISVTGEKLRCRPASALSSELREGLKANRAGVIEAIRNRRVGTFVWPDDPFSSVVPVSVSQANEPAPEWPEAIASLVEWFQGCDPPSKPFALRQAVGVIDPAAFIRSLRADIAAGPFGVRSVSGALAIDLGDLRRIVEGAAA